MHVISMRAFRDEMEKIAAGNLSPMLSMGGLAGLTAVEGAGAFNKNKSKKSRLKDGASAGFTGSILAAEAIHNKKMLSKGLSKLRGVGGQVLKHASVEKLSKVNREALRHAMDHGSRGVQPQVSAPEAPKQRLSQFDHLMRQGDLQPGHAPAGPVHSGLELAKKKVKLPAKAVGTAAAAAPKSGILSSIASRAARAFA
jgi:hypothetical protein